MEHKYHIEGTEKFGYSCFNRFQYSFYMYMNTVNRINSLYKYASIQDLKGYVAHYCYLRLRSFDTFLKVLVEHKDHVSAICLLRMLGDCVAVFRLIYREPDKDLLILRHCLYVIDGCECNLKVLPEKNVNEDCLSEEDLAESNIATQRSRAHRLRLIHEAQEMLNASPLRQKDNAAFDRIVEDRNWKFKEFKDDKKEKNQYQWREMYELIDCCKGFDLLSYISQYAHGLSMSNLVLNLTEKDIDGIIAEALGLIKRLHEYTMAFYPEEQSYILEGLLEPAMREKILNCYDNAHRPDIATWNQDVMNMLQQLSQTGSYEIMF